MPITISGDSPNFSSATITSGTITTNTVTTLNTPSGVLETQNGMTGIAKAWVNFNGTGTVAIRDSFNVSSITDNGTGDYTVNFTTALPNANYSVCGLGQFDQTPAASSPALISIYRSSTALATSSCRILSTNSNTTSTVDFPTITLSFFSS